MEDNDPHFDHSLEVPSEGDSSLVLDFDQHRKNVSKGEATIYIIEFRAGGKGRYSTTDVLLDDIGNVLSGQEEREGFVTVFNR